MKFRESNLAHKYLDGLEGLEIGGSAHNAFGLNTRNVDYTDALDTVFKQHEIELCGEAMPVDIVAPGDHLPLPDKSVDFVISSHVIEHFFDPIAALKEWARVARRWLYIIVPQRDALPSDRELPITPLEELIDRHEGRAICPYDPEWLAPGHYTRWTPQTFVTMCEHFGFVVEGVQYPDDKVGNGFAVIIKLEP